MLLQPTVFLLNIKDFMLPCLNKALFGLECPGCGLQRSVVLLFEGNFLAAFKMYPAIFTLIPFFLLLAGGKIFSNRALNTLTTGLGVTSVVLILINFIIKLIQ
ncbi:DUF2752 domain-containing protein [Muricauda sp. JGD-17]|uniref:DUF2752 domain-containing protein n=1 Tax=Flagellimonas ochracea TaxID=2696472 RepID=A0A964T8Y8_9FLAO|nr:DUF2752 domain-containing protein [Allomuricauda ochracea]NAY90422.1 DUF2752 domain-containing protein [Allomuricauda ochracea]